MTLYINTSIYARITMTSFIKKNEVKNNWILINAENTIVGRLAAYISKVLRGKNKNQYTPNMDVGDFVIVTNIDKIKFTGKKLKNKKYYRHTGYPGGLKSITAERLIEKKPTEVVNKAIRGMLPKTSLGKQMAKKLRIYAGADHPHSAQNPELWS